MGIVVYMFLSSFISVCIGYYVSATKDKPIKKLTAFFLFALLSFILIFVFFKTEPRPAPYVYESDSLKFDEESKKLPYHYIVFYVFKKGDGTVNLSHVEVSRKNKIKSFEDFRSMENFLADKFNQGIPVTIINFQLL